MKRVSNEKQCGSFKHSNVTLKWKKKMNTISNITFLCSYTRGEIIACDITMHEPYRPKQLTMYLNPASSTGKRYKQPQAISDSLASIWLGWTVWAEGYRQRMVSELTWAAVWVKPSPAFTYPSAGQSYLNAHYAINRFTCSVWVMRSRGRSLVYVPFFAVGSFAYTES